MDDRAGLAVVHAGDHLVAQRSLRRAFHPATGEACRGVLGSGPWRKDGGRWLNAAHNRSPRHTNCAWSGGLAIPTLVSIGAGIYPLTTESASDDPTVFDALISAATSSLVHPAVICKTNPPKNLDRQG